MVSIFYCSCLVPENNVGRLVILGRILKMINSLVNILTKNYQLEKSHVLEVSNYKMQPKFGQKRINRYCY